LGTGSRTPSRPPEALANVLADEYGLPGRRGETVSALARAVVSGAVTLDGSEPLEELVGSLVAVPGISAAAAHHIALRLGARDAFPAMDANVQRELRRRGPRPTISTCHLCHGVRAWQRHALSTGRRARPALPGNVTRLVHEDLWA